MNIKPANANALATALAMVIALGACAQQSETETQAPDGSVKLALLERCYDMLDAGDERVYDECFTEDFWVKGPETVNEPGGIIQGRNAIAGKMAMGGTDLQAYRKVTMDTTILAETDDVLVVNERWVGRGPLPGGYAAMGDPNPPADLEVVNDMIDVYTFRDGKIASQFFQYDTMNFVTTLAQGDPDRIVAFIQSVEDMAQPEGTDFEAMMESMPSDNQRTED